LCRPGRPRLAARCNRRRHHPGRNRANHSHCSRSLLRRPARQLPEHRFPFQQPLPERPHSYNNRP
jgi:hypothetical protein